jgi:hypothetical protein
MNGERQTAPGTSWPDAAQALDIHARLCDDDPVASAELAEAFIDPLTNWLVRTHPRVDEHLCAQAAEDAILSLIDTPDSYDPERGALDAYLRMSARGDLRNTLQSEHRHGSRREQLEVVELLGSDRNVYQEDSDPARIVEREDDEREFLRRLLPAEVVSTFSWEERWVLELMQQGERRTSAFARVLAISHLPENEQRREVKRAKDRIKRRLQRQRGSR